MRILLIAGGWSSERQVSLSGAQVIREGLLKLGHEVRDFDPSFEFAGLGQAAGQADFAFLNLHGSPGEDGLIQAMLERAHCPYQGSAPAGSFLALHKAASKAVFRDQGLPTPAFEYLTHKPGPDYLPQFAPPYFIKPNLGGSSLGMSLVGRLAELAPAIELAFEHGGEVLVEPALPGPELTSAVLGAEALPPILIRPAKGRFFDYWSKYDPKGAQEICPAPVSPELTHKLGSLALAAHRALGLRGYSRSDFMLDGEGEPWLLEVNTLPGMTRTSLLPRAARAAGLDFEALLARLIELGLADCAAAGTCRK